MQTSPSGDAPLMQQAQIREVEALAIKAYRSRYPDAPPWQELAVETRVLWVDFVGREQARQTSPGERRYQ